MTDRLTWPAVLASWALLALAGCASSGAVPRPFPGAASGSPAAEAPSPPPPAEPDTAPDYPAPSVTHLDGYSLSTTALSLRGAPYRNGGSAPDGFDCSGFVQYVFGLHGVPVPRETRQQFRIGRSIDRSRLAPGDLVFFSTTAPGASHVGIVIGEDQFVHAPSSRGVVRVERLSSDYWRRRYIGARRAE